MAECLHLITTEPDKHYDLYFDGLNWKNGRAFCLTSNTGIPHGPSRNKIVGQLMRDGFTATVVRVFSSATATGTIHHEAMALARSNIDRFIGTGVIPPIWTDRLQCTLAGQPLRLMAPTSAAHAVVTPTTMRARFHTVPMAEAGQSSSYSYDQMDRHQKDTVNEVSGVLEHEWDEPKAKEMMQRILEVAKYERISVHLTVTSDTRILITPGPSPTDNSNLQKACSQYCDRLRKQGETGLQCHFDHAPPHRPNPIPQVLQNLIQYEPAVAEGIRRWSRAAQRTADCAPELEGTSARTFLSSALAGTNRFHPPASEETSLALRSTNTELVKSNVALKQQVAQLGSEQLALRTEANQRMAAFVDEQRAENLKYQTQMMELHRASAAANAEIQAKLDALVRAVTELPDGAQVRRNVFKSADPPSVSATGTSEVATPGDAEAEPKPDSNAPPHKVGAPPSPELSDGLDDGHGPLTQPTTFSLPNTKGIATWSRSFDRFASKLRSGTASRPQRHTRPPPLLERPPGPDLGGRNRETASTGLTDAQSRRHARLPLLDHYATDAHRSGSTYRSAGATPIASEPDQELRTTVPPPDAAPGTPSTASSEGNAALHQEHTLLFGALRVRRAHLLHTLQIERTRVSLTIASCDRPVCLPGHDAHPKYADPPSGSEPDPCTERASGSSHRATPSHFQDRPTPPQRHPTDPADPCVSFSTASSPEERSRSHARIVWTVATIDAALEQSGEARSLPTTCVQKPNPFPSGTLEAALPTEALMSPPIPDSRPSSAQPLSTNRHLTEDEQGTSSKFPEVKGDGALPAAPDLRLGQGTEGGNGTHGHEGTNGTSDHYEPATAPSSTDRPRPEHMVNAAEPVGRGVMIRAGGGAGSPVSDESPTRSLAHVSANKKASPTAQDSHEETAGQLGPANDGEPSESPSTLVSAAPEDALLGTPYTTGTCRSRAEPPVSYAGSTAHALDLTPRPCDASRSPPSRRRIDNEHEASTFRTGVGDGAPEAPNLRPEEDTDQASNSAANHGSTSTLADFNRKAVDAYDTAMKAAYNNPSSELDLAARQALEQMLAGIKVHNGAATLSSLARYGHYPSGAPEAYDDIGGYEEANGPLRACDGSKLNRPPATGAHGERRRASWPGRDDPCRKRGWLFGQ